MAVSRRLWPCVAGSNPAAETSAGADGCLVSSTGIFRGYGVLLTHSDTALAIRSRPAARRIAPNNSRRTATSTILKTTFPGMARHFRSDLNQPLPQVRQLRLPEHRLMGPARLIPPLAGQHDLVALRICTHRKMRGFFRGILGFPEHETPGSPQDFTGSDEIADLKIQSSPCPFAFTASVDA